MRIPSDRRPKKVSFFALIRRTRCRNSRTVCAFRIVLFLFTILFEIRVFKTPYYTKTKNFGRYSILLSSPVLYSLRSNVNIVSIYPIKCIVFLFRECRNSDVAFGTDFFSRNSSFLFRHEFFRTPTFDFLAFLIPFSSAPVCTSSWWPRVGFSSISLALFLPSCVTGPAYMQDRHRIVLQNRIISHVIFV